MTKTEIPTQTQLFCQICGKPIPEEKAKRRSNTCGTKECMNALRRFRANLLSTGKCPHCYHPSSPEEWAQFRQWRQWAANQSDTTLQSFMRASSGMTLRSLTRKLQKATKDALQAAADRHDLILAQSCLKNGDGNPDLRTLPEDCMAEISALEGRIREWTAILDSAKEVLPEKAVDAKAQE